jgi:hypothetical protein
LISPVAVDRRTFDPLINYLLDFIKTDSNP